MSVKNTSADPLQIAAVMFRQLQLEFERDGVPAGNAYRSLAKDSRLVGRRLFLRKHAFKPTGVALGCPLPSTSVQSLFSMLCGRTEEYLRQQCGIDGPALSCVPPEAYHITLVNRTHFDAQKDKRNVHPLSLMEKRQVEQIMDDERCGAIVVRYRGLFATKGGRLMVPAYPEGTGIFRLKEALRNRVVGRRKQEPVLAENYPVHTLTKLGHIVVPLNGTQLRCFSEWLQAEGANVDVVVKFTDVYTQHGRIPL